MGREMSFLMSIPAQRGQEKRPVSWLIRGVGFEVVPEARVELARRETTVFETAASAIPPLGHVALAVYRKRFEGTTEIGVQT